jgi:hypothetical protein
MKLSTLAVALAVPATLMQAQSPLSGLAQGLLINDTSSTSLRLKPPGDLPLSEFGSMGAEAPTYTTSALLHHLGGGNETAIDKFQMNAISTGNDLLPMELITVGQETYWQVNGLGGWSALALSVSNGSAPNGQVMNQTPNVFVDRHNEHHGHGIGSDLFSYWFDTNTVLPPSLTDAAHLDLGHEHMGLSDEDVTGLDTYMPAVVAARGQFTFVTPVVDRWYFTLTPESVGHIETHWSTYQPAFAVGMPQSDIGANYVYQSLWTPGNGWSEIGVLSDPEDLGLLTLQNAEIDAIAFYASANFNEQIVFSLTRQSSNNLEQLLVGGTVHSLPQGPVGNKPLRAWGGEKITAKIGIGSETEVDAVCTYDPENANEGHGDWIAFPINSTTVSEIGCSATRSGYFDNLGVIKAEQLLMQATDLPSGPAMINWVITIDGVPLVKRLPVTGDRMQYKMRLPLGCFAHDIQVTAVYWSPTKLLRSYTVRLLHENVLH